jgi:hypothetical protein
MALRNIQDFFGHGDWIKEVSDSERKIIYSKIVKKRRAKNKIARKSRRKNRRK